MKYALLLLTAVACAENVDPKLPECNATTEGTLWSINYKDNLWSKDNKSNAAKEFCMKDDKGVYAWWNVLLTREVPPYQTPREVSFTSDSLYNVTRLPAGKSKSSNVLRVGDAPEFISGLYADNSEHLVHLTIGKNCSTINYETQVVLETWHKCALPK